MAINKKASKIKKPSFLKLYFFTVFISSIISLNVITELSIILAKYFPFSQLNVAGFQKQSFSYKLCFLHSHQRL